jgi:hypothetical protein
VIRTIVQAWLTGVSLVFGAAILQPGQVPQSAPAEPAPTPDAPAVVPGPVAQPAPAPAAMPASVRFKDQRTAAIVGDRVTLELIETGEIKSRTWTVLPPGTIGLKVSRSGEDADFTSRFPGVYVFLVAVAGADGSVAQAFHTVELKADLPAPIGAPTFIAGPSSQEPAQPPTPSERIRQMTADIRSPNKAFELGQIRSALILTAGSIDAGLLAVPPGQPDPIGYLLAATKGQAALSLGGNLGPWDAWFDKLGVLYREMERLKALNSPANFSAANKSVVRALEDRD